MKDKINLKELVQINQNFQKSIHIRMDYNQIDKIESYIPTKASIQVLDKYLSKLGKKDEDRATMLIGPYGKGKSHLLLILVALLSQANRLDKKRRDVLEKLITKIGKISLKTEEKIRILFAENKVYLPVFVTATTKDMDKAFLLALKEGLEREGLSDISPDTYFEKALEVIKQWQEQYPDTYQSFCEALAEIGENIIHFQKRLQQYDQSSLVRFQEIYPRLTAGSVFEPMVQMDVVELYKIVNQSLCSKYGYQGIILIFDEFSKFLEGYPKERISAVMELIQRIGEAANRTKGEELHVILVAHKAIMEYKNLLEDKIINAYRGIEGRLAEVRFTVSMKNSYEIIGNAMPKNEVLFAKEIKQTEWYENLKKESYHLLYFRNHFAEEKEFEDIVMKGCFPLLPVAAYLLLRISECAVQNERTVFTFLAHKEPHSLAQFLEKHEENQIYMCADSIYDYFYYVFKHDNSNIRFHNEWLKAEYAINQVNSLEKVQIIKVLALLRMVGKKDEMYPRDEVIRLGTGLSTEIFDQCMEELKEEQILFYRNKTKTYAFRNNIGVDMEKEIRERVNCKFQGISICEEIEKISELEYELPRRYNQNYCITRYFQYCFMEMDSFLVLSKSEYLFEDSFSDGKIIALIKTEEIPEQAIFDKLNEWKDSRILVVLPEEQFTQQQNIEKLLAICDLKEDSVFLEENKALLQELSLYEEDLRFEINAALESYFFPLHGKCRFYHKKENKEVEIYTGEKMLQQVNQLLSEICEQYYEATPKINNELINKRNLSVQIQKARMHLADKFLKKENLSSFQKGTSPEATIYRAVFVRTGLLTFEESEDVKSDWGAREVVKEIEEFLFRAAGKKVCFKELYKLLQGKKYGLRKGVMPLYLAYVLASWEDTPIIYLGKKEINLDAKILENINDTPSRYFLYVEVGNARKRNYLSGLEQLFDQDVEQKKRGKGNTVKEITDKMYEWYCSLPQCSRQYEPQDAMKNIKRGMQIFRQEFGKLERNPREVLFEQLPEGFETGEEYEKLLEQITQMKSYLDGYYSKLQQSVVKALREGLNLSATGDLLGELRTWSQGKSKKGRQFVYSTQNQRLLSAINRLNTHDETKISEEISLEILDLHIADWKEETLEEFKNVLSSIQKERKNREEQEPEDTKRIIFTNSQGVEVERCFTIEEENHNAKYLENEILSTLEEYGYGLETNQKLSVMLKMIERLLT